MLVGCRHALLSLFIFFQLMAFQICVVDDYRIANLLNNGYSFIDTSLLQFGVKRHGSET